VLLALVADGMPRDGAYRLVQWAARRAADGGEHLRDVLAADPAVTLDAATLAACFDPARHVERAAVVFERLEESEL
jgi:adenylosuccinate lyase